MQPPLIERICKFFHHPFRRLVSTTIDGNDPPAWHYICRVCGQHMRKTYDVKKTVGRIAICGPKYIEKNEK